MNESNEPSDAQAEADVRSLDRSARDVLAVLAVCGRGSLSAEELGELTGLSEVRLTVAELERRGLVVRDNDRYSLAPPARGPLQRLVASVDVTDRVLRGFIHIAEDGRLTLDDLDAVLELTRIAAETGRWKELLRLTEAAETTLSTAHRVEDWVEITNRRGEAKRALESQETLRQADKGLIRASGPPGGGVRLTLFLLAGAAVGVGAGYLIGGGSSTQSTETVTEAGAAATETVTETTITTTTTTTTVTSPPVVE